MNRFDLNTEELINLLIDKDTSAVDKSQIMEELQNRPDSSGLLQEYSHLQNILENVKSPVSVPPPDWTTSVLEQVKYISEQHFGFSWFGKLKYALLGLILLIPFGLYLAFDNPENTTSKNTTSTIGIMNNSNSEEIHNQESQLKNSDRDIAKETNRVTQLNYQSANKQISVVPSQTTKIDETIETNTSPVPEPTYTEVHNTFDNYDYSSLLQKNVISSNLSLSNFTDIVSQILPIKMNYSRTQPSKINIMLQTRGSYALTNPEMNFAENDFIGNTYNLGVYVDVYENVYAGAEFGSEVFSQIFVGSEQPGEIYDQTPTLFYFGLSGKYEFNQLSLGIVKPVGHLFVGGSSLGPLVRANAVIQANLLNQVGIFVGLEGGLLYYKNQNTWYNSSKLGIVGGINFKF